MLCICMLCICLYHYIFYYYIFIFYCLFFKILLAWVLKGSVYICLFVCLFLNELLFFKAKLYLCVVVCMYGMYDVWLCVCTLVNVRITRMWFCVNVSNWVCSMVVCVCMCFECGHTCTLFSYFVHECYVTVVCFYYILYSFLHLVVCMYINFLLLYTCLFVFINEPHNLESTHFVLFFYTILIPSYTWYSCLFVCMYACMKTVQCKTYLFTWQTFVTM